MIMEIISIILSTLIIIWMSQGSWARDWVYFIDFPTLVCMLILILPMLMKKGLARDLLRAFKLLKEKYVCSFSELRHALDVVEVMQKQILCAGVIVSFQGIYATFRNLSDFTTLGANLSIALLAVFYTAILELLLLPLQIEVKRRMVDYMEQEPEETEKEQDAEET